MNRLIVAVVIVGAMAVVGSRAADITAQAVLKVTKGYIDIQRAANTDFSIASSPAAIAGFTQTIETNAAEQITIGDVATKGWSWFRNLSSNGNAVAVGVVDASTNFIEFARLAAGEYGLIPLGTNTIWARSYGTNAASCELEKIIVSD